MSGTDDPAAPDAPAAPAAAMITVTRGDPTEEELAAVITVLLALRRDSSAPARGPSGSGSQWSAYWRGLRTAPPPGPGAWRQSARS